MRAGFYRQDSDMVSAALVGGLSSNVRVGFIRLNGQQSLDQMSEIVNAIIRSYVTQRNDESIFDFNTQPDSTVDWNIEVGNEDYGDQPLNKFNHRLKLIATNDGRTIFAEAEPDEIRVEPQARYYACSLSGVWHIVEVSAESPGESFRLNSLELTVIDAGRLL